MMNKSLYNMDDLLYLMERLRNPKTGCAWDRQQTQESLVPYTLEEVYELVDAIAQGDVEHIREELGDVLFQVIFYAQLSQEEQQFDFADIVHTLCDKLLRRHPRVFAEGDLHKELDETADIASIKKQWEVIKQQERDTKQQSGLLDDIPKALPALKRAQKLQKRAADVGFDWPAAQSALSKISEELAELAQAIDNNDAENTAEEIGDLLFSCVNVARHLQLDAETMLLAANRKFEQRFSYIEQGLKKQGKTVKESSLLEMDSLWQQSKLVEKQTK